MSTTITITPHVAVLDSRLKVPESGIKASTSSHRALIINSERKYELRHSFETSASIGPHEVKIRSCAVGLNHIDFKSVDYNFCLPDFPWITGREMAGVVEQTGAAVVSFKKGDKVWTSTYYRDLRAGCFQEFVIVPVHTVTKMGPNMQFTTAACLGVCGLTAAMTLWKWFQIPMPSIMNNETRLPEPTSSLPGPTNGFLLVWGGSSVTGQFVIQIAKLGGLRVISVGSAATADLVLQLGAEFVVLRDAKSNDEIVDEIKTRFGNDITMGIDLVNAKTCESVIRCLSNSKAALFAPLATPGNIQVAPNVNAVNVEMKQFILDPASVKYSDKLSYLVDTGRIKMPEIEVLPGGLEVVEAGLEKLKLGSMVGKKLVVSMT